MVSTTLQMDMELEANLHPEPTVQKPKPPGQPERVRIVLDEDDSIPPGGLHLGLNGYAYRLMPGMEVDVPIGIIDILDHAIMSVPVTDPGTMKTIGYREKRRYSYRRV